MRPAADAVATLLVDDAALVGPLTELLSLRWQPARPQRSVQGGWGSEPRVPPAPCEPLR